MLVLNKVRVYRNNQESEIESDVNHAQSEEWSNILVSTNRYDTREAYVFDLHVEHLLLCVPRSYFVWKRVCEVFL